MNKEIQKSYKETLINIHKIQDEEWYQSLVEDCRATVVECVAASRWILVEGYWTIGQRIRDDENVKKYGKGSAEFLASLANNIGISTRTLYYSLQAYDKFPTLDEIPEGKNISWNKLITLYLPQKKEEVSSLPKGKYDVILCDAPWKYNDKHDYNGTTGAETHYSTMTIEELSAMKIPSADDAVMFFWVTSPLLEECFKIINAWGFQYKTSFVWDKVKHNMGHYNSVRHEFLLVCVKGSKTPEVQKLFDSVIVEERSEKHSEKPKVIYEIIETLYPSGKYLELFGRKKREGWTIFGNEI